MNEKFDRKGLMRTFKFGAIALAVLMLFEGVNQLTANADALDSGNFCIQAASATHKSEKVGNCAGVPSGEEQPGEQYETLSPEVTHLTETVGIGLNGVSSSTAGSYRAVVTRHAGPTSEVVYDETARILSGGVSGIPVTTQLDRERSDAPFYVSSYTVRYEFDDGRSSSYEVTAEMFEVSGSGASQAREAWVTYFYSSDRWF